MNLFENMKYSKFNGQSHTTEVILELKKSVRVFNPF